MFDVIASSFFQKKSCHLPCIGKLSFLYTPAAADVANAEISAPQQTIIFTPTDSNENIFNEFSAISELMQQKLTTDKTLDITGIGTFIKDAEGIIHFIPIDVDPVFLQPVNAAIVTRQMVETAMPVGDINTTTPARSKKQSEVIDAAVEKKSNWWIWAIVLAAVSLSLIVFYLYNFGFNNAGNCTPLTYF